MVIDVSRSELIPIMEEISSLIAKLELRLQHDPENYGFILAAIEDLQSADSLLYHCLVE